jgi:tetratricopeptide (TPR) repeat protein
MITTRHMQLEVELVRWMILVLAALALVLAAATLAAADPMTPPRLLPPDIARLAKPIAPTDAAPPFFPEEPPAREFPSVEAAARLWRILELQKTGCTAEALAGWARLRLPDEAAHWRELAIGAGYLKLGDLQQAEDHLQVARQLAPGNALVAYQTGLLRLEQRARVSRVPDELNGRKQLLVAFTPRENRAMYERLAVHEFQEAILRAPTVQPDERLLATDMNMEQAVCVPCVGDLLTAIGADNFVGKAHHLLYGLHLDRGELLNAEVDLDAAVASGVCPLYGYRDLAEAYVNAGQPQVLTRLMHKDLNAAEPWLRPACERLVQWTREAVTPEPWVW